MYSQPGILPVVSESALFYPCSGCISKILLYSLNMEIVYENSIRIGVNISERKSWTKRTKKHKNAGVSSIFRVNFVVMVRVSKLLGSNFHPNPNFALTLIRTLNSP